MIDTDGENSSSKDNGVLRFIMSNKSRETVVTTEEIL